MAGGCFKVAVVRFSVHIHPSGLSNLQDEIKRHLNMNLMRYLDVVGGVLVSYGHIEPLASEQSLGTIHHDMPFIHFHVQTRCVVFAPQMHSVLECVVNHSTSGHVGALCYGIFNVALSAKSLKTAGYSYHSDSRSFKHESLPDITEGSVQRFVCKGVNVSGDLITIRGDFHGNVTSSEVKKSRKRKTTQDEPTRQPKRKRKVTGDKQQNGNASSSSSSSE